MASFSAQLPNGYGDEHEWKRTLPPGHGFYPTDHELITNYLKRKAQNLVIHAGIINDLDIYNYHPEELKAIALNQWDGRMYFFTAFKRKVIDGWRGDREVGGGKGHWKASQAREKLRDGGDVVIGTKQPLVFHDGKGAKTSWLMTEFRYPADFKPLPLYNQTVHELALCVIYYHGKRTTKDGNQESKGNNTNSMENLQSCNLIPTPCPNPNFTTTSTLQNSNYPSYPTLNPNFNATSLQSPDDPPSLVQRSNFIATSSLYPTQSPNFNATFALQSPNHPPSPCQNSNFIATSSLYPAQNTNFNSTFTLQSPNHPPSPAQNSNFIATTSSLYPAQNPNFNSTFTLQSPNHPPSPTQNSNFIATTSSLCPTQNPYFDAAFAHQNPNHPPSPNSNFIATSSMQNANNSLSFVQNSNFIVTSSLQNPNHPLSLSQNSNFIATSSQQNFDYSQSSIQNPNFIATPTQQNSNFPQYSLPQNSSLQDAWNELFSLFTAEEIRSYFNADGNEDTFQLHVLSYDSDDKDKDMNKSS